MKEEGTHVVSCDEKSGIQALERMKPTKPPKPGQIEKREYEYRRHGTQCLIGSFDVATGEIVGESIGPTRDESDFLAHIKKQLQSIQRLSGYWCAISSTPTNQNHWYDGLSKNVDWIFLRKTLVSKEKAGSSKEWSRGLNS